MDQKLTFLLPSLRGGGAERTLVTLANEFARQGISTDLVVVSSDGPNKDLLSPHVNLIDLKGSRVAFSIFSLIRYFQLTRPSAAFSALDNMNILAIIARMLAGSPNRLVISVRNHLSTSSANDKTLFGRINPLASRLYHFADEIVGISEGVAEDLCGLARLKRERVRVIYNPVVDDQMLALGRLEFQHHWLSDPSVPVILAVGRLVPQKDYPTLIHAFSLVRAKQPAKLLILGDGPEWNKLKKLISSLGLTDDIELAGYLSNPYVCMRLADVFALSSQWEGFGRVLVEAMAFGTPVVATDCPSGPREILEDGKWGKLVPLCDPASFANALLEQLNGPRVLPGERALAFSVEESINRHGDALFGS